MSKLDQFRQIRANVKQVCWGHCGLQKSVLTVEGVSGGKLDKFFTNDMNLDKHTSNTYTGMGCYLRVAALRRSGSFLRLSEKRQPCFSKSWGEGLGRGGAGGGRAGGTEKAS